MQKDMNTRVREYLALVESLAAKLARSPRAVRVGAEYDDLVQEGLIEVWQALEKDVTPASEPIRNRMRNWIRLMGRQRNGEEPLDALLTWLDSDDVPAHSQTRRDVERLVETQK